MTHEILPHGLPKQIAPDLWQVRGSLPIPLSRNMTVVRMHDGGLLLHSVIAMNEEGMTALEDLGRPAAIVVPFEEDRPEMADLLLEMLARSLEYLEMRLIGTVIAPGVTKRGEVMQKPDRLREARDLGRKLAAARP